MEMHIGNRVADVMLVSKDGNNVKLTVDGKPYAVDVVMAENGSCSILHNGYSYNAELVRGDGGKSYDVNLYHRSFHVDVVDRLAKYLHLGHGKAEPQADKIVAPMPGKVVSVAVAEGDRLEAGAVAVVLESMKMHSNCKVSAPCVVTRVHVAEGDAVAAGQTLVELDLGK